MIHNPPSIMSPTHPVLRLLCLASVLLVLGGGTGCARSSAQGSSVIRSADLRQEQIIETATGRTVSFDQLAERLAQQEVVYIGEEHHHRFHVDAALSLLQRFTTETRRPALAMEMFGWDGQGLLDRYVGGSGLGRQEFLEQIGWQHNWGGPFEDYEPLVAYAKTHQLTLAALNPPKTLVRTVARKGLVQARLDPDWIRWGLQDETIVDDPAYRERILQQLRACHDAGPDALYQTMYEASMVRDEGMAKTIVSLVEARRTGQASPPGPVVSYTGGGHIQYQLPVPNRVARRLAGRVRQLSVYLTSYEESRGDELRDIIEGRIADYVWLTPVGAHGPPRRCR